MESNKRLYDPVFRDPFPYFRERAMAREAKDAPNFSIERYPIETEESLTMHAARIKLDNAQVKSKWDKGVKEIVIPMYGHYSHWQAEKSGYCLYKSKDDPETTVSITRLSRSGNNMDPDEFCVGEVGDFISNHLK